MIHDDRILQSAYSVIMPVQSYSRKCRLASRKLQVGVLKGEKLQFTRTIRKSASSMLSAASQLIFAHKMALPSCPSEFRFSCKHGI